MTAPNKQLIKEWRIKAEGDWQAVVNLNRGRSKKKLLFIIAFHCQQAIEKFLKALLICYAIDFPKTHDLLRLVRLLKNEDPFLLGLENDFDSLNPYAVGFRYPGDDITPEELKKIIKKANRLVKLLTKRVKEFL